MSSLPIEIRSGQPSDVPFIIKSWLKGYRLSRKTQGIDNETYYSPTKGHRAIVVRLLGTAPVAVATNPERLDQIYGFLCHGPMAQVAHYIYVKRAFQGFGIAHMLLEETGLSLADDLEVTHWNDVTDRALREGAPLRYNPYLAMETTWATETHTK